LSKQQTVTTLGLGLIVLLAAFLRFYQLGAYSIGNAYYVATVQSMLTSWRNFFFAAFEPAGSVTVDKPPLGFWVQAASAYVFGVNGFAMAFPQALAGALSIPLLYVMVKHQFGKWAGLIAALVLATTPVAVSTERNNTVDGLLLFVLLLATWAFLRAVRSGRLRDLLLGVILVGLGFNIKMLQAFMPLPALYALYLFGAPHRWWKRHVHLAIATLVLVAVSLSWAIAVDLTPVESRPFVGSSTDNSALELIIGHNGLKRLGLDGLTASAPGGTQPAQTGQSPDYPPTRLNDGQIGQLPPNPPPSGPGYRAGPGNVPGYPPPPAQPVDPNAEIGQPGSLRLFTAPLVTEVSWLLPLILLGIPLILAQLGWQWPLSDKHLALVLWAGWLLPELVYFSFTSGLFHAYYLTMLGPPLAALAGATVWALAQTYQKHSWLGWSLVALFAGGTVAFQIVTLQSYPTYVGWVTALSVTLLTLGLGMLILTAQRTPPWNSKRNSKTALGIALLATQVAPLLWSGLTTFNTNPDVCLPRSGLHTQHTNCPTTLTTEQQPILDYLLANTDPDGYLVATLTATDAAPYILATQRPVLTFGGFTGNDNVVDLDQLRQMVADEELRFVLGQGLAWRKPEIAAWLNAHCAVASVPGITGKKPPPAPTFRPNDERQANTLYDCSSH